MLTLLTLLMVSEIKGVVFHRDLYWGYHHCDFLLWVCHDSRVYPSEEQELNDLLQKLDDAYPKVKFKGHWTSITSIFFM